ncbi:glycoside hydrolase domain-containing protein [Nocardioides sp.]|uniref:glycoside hydrolase domain-containing protein n=1 Tax=Nocardioides sp. TaxID=35761 RepID=UPI00356572B0
MDTVRPFLGRLAASLGLALALALGLVMLVSTLPANPPATSAGSGVASAAAAAAEPNPVTPGDFTGYGFDQCLAPTQAAMDRWLEHSPFLAVGIYISGNSRACRNQPNLTPTWIRTQLAKGWRLLPITLGPQASCLSRFPRYDDDPTINPKPGRKGKYSLARKQAKNEAITAVAEARRLGIVAGSTLWYDLEGFNSNLEACRESALFFLSAWTKKLHKLGYVSGVYSSVGSGIKVLDEARVNRPGVFTLPDAIWLARWDGRANTSSDYIREDGWRPGGRVKQYQGGHNEKWGGVTINIDRNFLDVGRGSVAAKEQHCAGTRVNFRDYPKIKASVARSSGDSKQVSALKCLLKEKGFYDGGLRGRYSNKLAAAIRAWKQQMGLKASDNWSRRNWVSLHATGTNPVLKAGSAGSDVRRLQRALNAASNSSRLPVNGVFDGFTARALEGYQARKKITASGIANTATWAALVAGRR